MKNSLLRSLNDKYEFRISKLVKETKDSVSVYFDLEDKIQEFKYNSGQHILLHLSIEGKNYTRAYSIFTAPFEEDFAITVKRVNKGLVSNYINDNFKAGDKIQVSKPRGNFKHIHSDQNKTYYFFGGGSGITPLLSHIKSILKTEQNSKVFLLYGNRNRSSIIHHDKLMATEKNYPNRFHIEHEIEEEGGFFGKGLLSNLLQTKTGWIDKRRVFTYLKENPTDLPSEYFVCGPALMIEKVEQALQDISIDSSHIHIERFKSIEKSSRLQTENSSNTQNVEIVYTIDKIKKRMLCTNQITLFDALTKNGENVPFSCLSGSCATCACILKKGKVDMKNNYALNDTQLRDNFILSCQAIPETSHIEVDFDLI